MEACSTSEGSPPVEMSSADLISDESLEEFALKIKEILPDPWITTTCNNTEIRMELWIQITRFQNTFYMLIRACSLRCIFTIGCYLIFTLYILRTGDEWTLLELLTFWKLSEMKNMPYAMSTAYV